MNDGRVEGGLRLSGLQKRSEPDFPLVSVLTVVLNRRNTVIRCMKSVADQTYPNIEYVIVDGGSTDGTLESIQANSNHVDYFVSQRDTGIYDAMNKGLSLLSGEFFLLLNADDWYETTAVEELVREAIRSRADVVHADAWLVNRFGLVDGRLNGWLNDGILTHAMSMRHETMLVRRSVHDRLGYYDTSYRIIADYEFALRLYGHGCSFSHIGRPLLYFRTSGISSTRRDLVAAERSRLYGSLFPFLDSSDLALMAQGLTNRQRRQLLAKHAGKSDSFTKSLTQMIADRPPGIRHAIKSLEQTRARPVTVAARTLLRIVNVLRYGFARRGR